MKFLFLCLVLASPALAQAPVSAANTERAREAFTAAQKLYQASRFAEALTKFEEAQALKPHPVITFNIARCQEQLGALPQALKAYREYLRLSPDAADKDAVLASIASLEKRVPKPSSQQLVVNAEPAASVVSVDGKRIGPAPVSIELPPGEHSLEVSAQGYETLKRTVTLATQRSVELNVALHPRPVAPVTPVTVTPVTPAPLVVADAPRKEPDLTPADAPPPSVVTAPMEPPARRRTFTWIAAGTAVASAGVATGLGLGAVGSVAKLKSGDGTRSGTEAGALATDAQGMALGANVAWGLAGAAAITAVVLFFVEGAPAAEATP